MPTPSGAQIKSELKGFKMYLETSEKRRLNFSTPSEKMPELFEKLLPYAIALGVANKWGKKFTNALEQHNYNPSWYIGSTIFRPYNFATSFPISFSNTINSASIGASGSGGGGFSGGGGGGGGGRGW